MERQEDNRLDPAEDGVAPAPVRAPITAACALWACRVCRTKTGWPHQRWCGLLPVTSPDCGDCRYRERKAGQCKHPARRKGGDAK